MNVKFRPLLSNTGLKLGSATALLSAVLDQEQDSFPSGRLYAQSWTCILFNLMILGPFVFQRLEPRLKPRSIFTNWIHTFSIVGIHSAVYAVVHRCMHRIRALRPIHEFHHRFTNQDKTKDEGAALVLPSSANAVSAAEFATAYMMPFAIATTLLEPSSIALATAAMFISVFNLCVHSNHLKHKAWVPFFVAPLTHLTHHERRTPHYAAPTFHIPMKVLFA